MANSRRFSDGTRRDAGFRQRQHEWYLRKLSVNHVLVGGSVQDRLLQLGELLYR
jgi:hypothetical protein